MNEKVTDKDIKDYIKERMESHQKIYFIELSKEEIDFIFYYWEEHLKDSHQLSDLVELVMLILHRRENG